MKLWLCWRRTAPLDTKLVQAKSAAAAKRFAWPSAPFKELAAQAAKPNRTFMATAFHWPRYRMPEGPMQTTWARWQKAHARRDFSCGLINREQFETINRKADAILR